MQGAIRGLIGALDDPNSSYMDPSEYEQANMPLVGSYDGIGAWVDSEAEYLTIIAPMPGSPAERAGLQPGDEVVAIDGEDMTGIDPSLAIRLILGPAGSSVRLTILRQGETDTFEVEVERAHIDLPNVESEMLDPGIGYVRLYTFGTNTDLELRQALEDLMADDPRGLILDLRGNGGGFLSSAISVASEFIGDGVVMVERYGDGREEVFQAEPGGAATEIPLVVLIDGGSASASEIVAGAIQDRGRGQLVGETSFGKGSVQEWIPLTADSGAVRVTVARWLTPSRRQIDEVGLSPDVAVELTDEDLQAQRDPQLDRAIEVLLGEAAR
jgi:carboxyl-terminal processing protease